MRFTGQDGELDGLHGAPRMLVRGSRCVMTIRQRWFRIKRRGPGESPGPLWFWLSWGLRYIVARQGDRGGSRGAGVFQNGTFGESR